MQKRKCYDSVITTVMALFYWEENHVSGHYCCIRFGTSHFFKIEKALDNLEKRAQDIQHYMNIMSKVKTVNVADDQDFQREFDFFYKVRREEKEELFLQRNYNGTVRRNRTS